MISQLTVACMCQHKALVQNFFVNVKGMEIKLFDKVRDQKTLKKEPKEGSHFWHALVNPPLIIY